MRPTSDDLRVRNARVLQSRSSRPQVHGALRLVGKRRVRPGTISACLMVKNEECMLSGCIESLRTAVDEIVVVDTGSTDRTREVAESHGACVFTFEWTGDFGAARTATLEHATGEWLMVIDADERLGREGGRPVYRDELWQAIVAGRADAYALQLINYDDMHQKCVLDEHVSTRIVRNDPSVRYVNRVHETLTLPAGATVLAVPGCQLHHLGYVRAVIDEKDKIRRNLLLLEEEVERKPEAASVHFYLAREHHRLMELAPALDEYRTAWDLLGEERPPYWGELVAFLARMYVATGRLDECVGHCDELLAAWPHFSDLWLHRGQALRLKGDRSGALQSFYKALGTHETNPVIPLHQKIVPAVAWTEIAHIYEDEGDLPKAVAAYRESLRAWPRLGHVVEPLGRLLLRSGEPASVVERTVLEAAGDDEPVVHAGLWHTFTDAHDWERALVWADRVVAHEPSADHLRRRAETLLYLGRHAGALRDLDACLEAGGTRQGDERWMRVVACLSSTDVRAAREAIDAVDPDLRLTQAARALADRMAGAAEPVRRGDVDLVVGLWELAAQLASAQGFQALEALLGLVADLGQPAAEAEENMARVLAAHGYLPAPQEARARAV